MQTSATDDLHLFPTNLGQSACNSLKVQPISALRLPNQARPAAKVPNRRNCLHYFRNSALSSKLAGKRCTFSVCCKISIDNTVWHIHSLSRLSQQHLCDPRRPTSKPGCAAHRTHLCLTVTCFSSSFWAARSWGSSAVPSGRVSAIRASAVTSHWPNSCMFSCRSRHVSRHRAMLLSVQRDRRQGVSGRLVIQVSRRRRTNNTDLRGEGQIRDGFQTVTSGPVSHYNTSMSYS